MTSQQGSFRSHLVLCTRWCADRKSSVVVKMVPRLGEPALPARYTKRSPLFAEPQIADEEIGADRLSCSRAFSD